MKKEKNNPLTIAYIIFLIMVWTVVAFGLLTSCSTTRKSVEYIHHTDTLRQVEYVYKTDSVLRSDSIWLHDSIFVSAKGDSVTIEKWHTKYVDKIRYTTKTDTIVKYVYKAKQDKQDKTIVKQKNYKPYMIIAGILLVIIVILYIIRRIRP